METVLPKLEILDLLDENESGWGPSTPQQVVDSGVPFQQFNKADRIGRVADWIGVDRFFRRGNERYNERVYGSAANAGSQFDYHHGGDENNFQLVDSSKPIQRPTQRNFRNRQLQFKKLLQKDQERKEQQIQGQNVKLKRSIAKEQQRAFKMWQRRGGNARQGQRPQGGRYQGDRPKDRQPSVAVDKSWTTLEDFDFPRLSKLSYPNAGPGKDIDNHQYGTLHYYDKMMDRVSVKNPVPLQKCGGTLFNGSTSDDPIIQELASKGAGNVFATDIILATLMSASRSVYSWDIVAERFGDLLFLDKRTDGINNPVDALTVSETSVEPPVWEGNGINNAKDLATEALYINQNFRRQVLKRNEDGYKLNNANMPFDDEIGDVECAYKYRKWSLGTGANGKPVELVCRTEHDGALMTPSGEVQMMTIKAFNEWDSSQAGGVDWRSKLDAQKGAVLATEIKNNNCKLAKWTIQALLANSDIIKFGYVSRYAVKNTAQHMILDTHTLRPSEFANNISLNMDNAWGVLRCIIDSLMKQPAGKYLLLKDPMSPVVRLYSVPENAFDGDKDDNTRAVDSDDE